MTIRRYRADDTLRLGQIWLEASSLSHAFFSPDILKVQHQQVCDLYLPHSETWVLETEGKLLGFVGLIDRFVGGLFVSPEVQGSGIGRLLMMHALRMKGKLELDVYSLNTGAVAFYNRLEFQETGRRPTDDQGYPFEVIRMKRSA
ncbi:GNAT family N-acetyltransferase [Asticcacaulis tiandongensis]|uniref:GNAT family N-acetyltransferase n=1 Tax=Asticcacaulis tiandongensis TaxID=2565365 RepID=UPI001C64031D|nr:GNAT family N-acetyltransferase [Asticcacaulis tiandongensis]